MNNKISNLDFDVKLDQFGRIDVKYYENLAKDMRARFLAEYSAQAKKSFGNKLSIMLDKFYNSYYQTSH